MGKESRQHSGGDPAKVRALWTFCAFGALLLAPACRGPAEGRDLALGASFSALPSIGVALGATQVFDANQERVWAIELEATHQPWDDEDLSDDGNPHAGDWTQIQLGVKRLSNPGGRRHWTQRYGLAWFRARGEPNIVHEEGDYEALYAGFGFETEIGRRVSIGPELSLMAAHREQGSGLVLVPQFNWHLIWRF